MWAKKLVAIGLLVAVVLVVPLQTLAQIEPRITYEEWCQYLGELYAELREARQATWEPDLSTITWATVLAALALVAGTQLLDQAEFEDYLADKYWYYTSQADKYRSDGYVCLLIGAAVVVLYAIYEARGRNKAAALHTRSPLLIESEIEKWERAGEYQMWFYPCEEGH